MRTLNGRLRKLRKEKGLSQYKAAEKLGFSRGKLANYEQGTREPDYETLQKLADFYDCSTDYLLGRSELTSREEHLLQDLDKDLSLEELQEKYSLTIDGKAATKKEIETAIAFIRSLRSM